MQKACAAEGAMLAEIREEKANAAARKIRVDSEVQFAIAGNDEKEEGRWIWPSDGQVFYTMKKIGNGEFEKKKEPGQYSNWYGETYDRGFKPDWFPGKHCMLMFPNGKWAGMANLDCTIRSLLCEAKVVSGTTAYLTDVSSSKSLRDEL